MRAIITTRYLSPAGELILGSFGDKLCLCDWTAGKRRDAIARYLCRHLNAEYQSGTSNVINQAITQLDEYFAGKRTAFSIPFAITGTPFQCRVRRELMELPYGVTVSYAEMARRIGNSKAIRAVASAIATNPMSVIVPCHRVIASDNSLTGYGGGLATKQFLLSLEACRNTGKSPWLSLPDNAKTNCIGV